MVELNRGRSMNEATRQRLATFDAFGAWVRGVLATLTSRVVSAERASLE